MTTLPSPITPQESQEERTLRLVMRLVLLRPPLRLEDLPEAPPIESALPTSYVLAHPQQVARQLSDAVLAALPPLFRSGPPRVRTAAAILLSCLVPHFTVSNRLENPPRAVPFNRPVPDGLGDALLACLDDPSPYYRCVASSLIGYLSGVTTERFRGARAAIARRLREPCPVIRAAAADSVARIGVSADTAAIRSALRHLLDEEDPTVLVAGLRAVGGFKDRATRPLIDRLPRLLEHPSAEVRDEAARAVASVGPRAARRAIVAALTRRIRSDETPQEALLAYAAIKVRPCELVLSELPRLLQHDSAQTVAAALQVVSVAGPLAGTDAIILGVVRILSSKNPDLIQRGLHALTAIGRPAGREDVILALEEILYAGSHSHTQAAIGAVRALGNVAFGRLMSGLMTVLAGPDRAKRDAAVRLTRSLREQAASPEVLDRLARLLQHEDPGIRASAVAALEGLGPAAATPGILEQLAELKGDADAAVRYHVGEALFALG